MNRTVMFGCGVALAISALACGQRIQREGDAKGTDQRAVAVPQQGVLPIALEGCLAKSRGTNEYILIEMDTAGVAVGTSGSVATGSTGDSVVREPAREASHEFRLHGDRGTLEDLVGRQVSVSGTLAQQEIVDADRMPKVEVASIDPVADSCGLRAPSR